MFLKLATPTNRDQKESTGAGRLIQIDINADSIKKVISLMQESIDDQDSKIEHQINIIKHVTKQYTQMLEDCGYEEGTLHRLMSSIPKTNQELVIKNQCQTFCLQMKQMVDEIKRLSEDVEHIDNQRKQFDYRLTYLESVAKNIVTQTEYRNDTIQFEEKLLNKTAKAIDSVLEELSKNKEYINAKTAEFQEKVNKSEMKTIWKIQDCEELLKQRVSEHYLENLLNSRDDKLIKSIDKWSDRNILRMDHVHKEFSVKIQYLEQQLQDDRKQNLDRENLFSYKKDTETLQKQLLSLETKVNEYNAEHEDTISDFKKSMIDFNKRVTEVGKGLSNITKEHEDLSNAAQMAAAAQELLNQCTMKLEATEKEVKRIQKTLETKITNDEFYKQIQRKMDRQEVNIQSKNKTFRCSIWSGLKRKRNA